MLVLYKRYRVCSLFLFFICIGGGCNVLPFGTVLKMDDMALSFTLLICGSHLLQGDWRFFVLDKLAKRIWLLFAFLVCVTLFSWLYYEVPFVLVLQMVRFHLYILTYFILRNQKYEDLIKVLKMLGSFTVICAVVFCLQIPLNRNLLFSVTDVTEGESETYGGITRFTNIPYYANFFLFLSVFSGSSFVLWKVRRRFYVPGIYVLMRLLSVGRTAILTTLGAVFLGVIWKRKRYIKWFVVGGFLLLPVLMIVQTTLENRGTGGDIEGILRGDYKRYLTGYRSGEESTTMLYRFAWVYERAEYLANRPFVEQLMGLPYISDHSPLIRKYVRFDVNSYNGTDDDQILRSYDIAWGNLITQFGILGSIALLNLWVFMGWKFYQYRHHPLAFAALIYFIAFFMESIAGMGFTQLKQIVPFFVLYILINMELRKSRII